MKKSIPIFLTFVILLGFGLSGYAVFEPDPHKAGMKLITYEELATVPIDQTYNYEDILEDKYINGIITKEEMAELKSQHSNGNYHVSSNGIVRYVKLKMDDYRFNNGLTRYVLTPIFYVGLYYTSDSEPDRIISLDEPHVQTLKGAKCIFTGNIFYRLESGNSFYYGVYGDVYKTRAFSSSAEVGSGLFKVKVTYSDEFIKNIDFDGRYYSPALEP